MTVNRLPSRTFTLFLLLSAADLVLTWVLLRNDLGQCYESNPLAGWVLASFGWGGLVAFKAAAVVLVGGLALLISRSRPRAAGRVLTFACSAVALVLVYSASLLGFLASPRNAEAKEYRAVQQEADTMEEQLGRLNERRRLVAGLCDDLLAQRRGLSEAAATLARSDPMRSSPWLRKLRERFPGYSEVECLAARLLEDVVIRSNEKDPGATGRVARRLQDEFQAAFGKSAPPVDQLLARMAPAASRAG